jgi:hypothetical protein
VLRKFGIIAVLSLIVAAIAAVPALAQEEFTTDVNFNRQTAPSGAHLANGAEAPVCTINPDNSVSCTGTTIGGVGNTNAILSLTATVTADLTCTNKGGNLVEPHSADFSQTVTPEPLKPDRNGQIVVPEISTTAVTEEDVLEGFTCPNGKNWTADVVDLGVTSFDYSLTFVGFDQPAITGSNA